MSFPTAQLVLAERAIRDSWGTTAYAAAVKAGVELTTGGWARVAFTVATMFPNADPLVNAAIIAFAPVSPATDDVDQIKIYTALTGGILLGSSAVFAQTDIADNGQLQIPIGGAEIQVA